jgi:hypothetical protein
VIVDFEPTSLSFSFEIKLGVIYSFWRFYPPSLHIYFFSLTFVRSEIYDVESK